MGNYLDEDIAQFLITSSVARFSFAYWDNFLDSSNVEPRLFGKKFWKKLFTGVSDAIGATAGAVAGSATVVGSIAGAIVGGSATSVAADKLWGLWEND